MSEPVVISLVSEGVAKLHAELRTIDQTIAEMERRSTRAAEAGARQRTTVARRAANDQQRLWRDTAKQAETWEKQRVQIAENSARMAGQLAKRQADTEIKEADRAARDKIRATERAERERQRIIDNSARMAGRIAEQEANREIAAMKRAQEARARWMTGMGGKVSGSVAGVARGGLTMLGSAATLGAGYAVADAARDALATDKAAQILSNVAAVPGEQSFSRKQILERASALSIRSNIAKGDVIAGLQAFTDISGKLGLGMENADFAAKVAKGQGADFKDVMQTLGTLAVQNPRLNQSGLQNLLAGIVGGARIGAISTADMAKYAGAITSTSGAYAGDQGTAQRHLLGLAQLVRPVLQSSDEAGTVVSRLSQDLASNAPKMAAAGVQLHAKGSHQLKDLSEIIPELMAKTGGDVGKLKHLGIGRESIRAFEALAPTFNAAGGGTAGKKAVEAEIRRFENASVGSEEVMKNFGDVMSTDAEKFDAAMTHIRDTLEGKLTPYIDRFADRVARFVDSGDMDRLITSIGKVADWFADNPLKGLGAVVLGKITLDLGNAAIGAGVKAVIVDLLKSAGAGGAPVPGGGGPSGVGRLAAGLTLATAALAYGDQVQNSGFNQGSAAGEDLVMSMTAKVKAGTMSPREAQKIIAGANKRLDDASWFGQFGDTLASPFSDDAAKRFAQRKTDDALTGRQTFMTPESTEQLRKAIADAVVKGANDGARQVATGGAGGSDYLARSRPLGTGGARQ